MPLLASFVVPAFRLRVVLCAALALAPVVAAPHSARAQILLTHTEDAAPIPAGTARFRVITGWTRWDSRFLDGHTFSLNDEISADSLGPRQLPLLAPVEGGLQTLSNNPLTRLTLGRLNAQSDIRTVTTPIVAEYGVTKRLSFGIMVPIIQTRRSIHFAMNGDSSRLGNVSFVPIRARGTAASANTAVYNAFTRAADSLTTLITKCPATPTAAGCAAVIANISGATSARDQAKIFATTLRTSLGTDSINVTLAPRTGTVLAAQIDARKDAINAQVQTFLGPTAGTSTNVFSQPTDFSYIDLQGRSGVKGLLESPLGGQLDSLQTSNRLVVGGFTFAARWQLLDNFQYDTLPQTGWQSRVAIGGEVRYESIKPDSAQTLGEVSPAQGSGVAVSGAMDLVRGRFGATFAARYDKAFARTVVSSLVGNPAAFYPVPVFGEVQKTRGSITTFDFTPRFLLGPYISFNGLYGVELDGPDAYSLDETTPCASCLLAFSTGFTPSTTTQTAQRIGIGFRYSTVNAYLSGSTRTPLEVSLLHLETFTGNTGTNKIYREQIQVRVYWALFNRR